MNITIADEQKQQFKDEGYFILQSAMRGHFLDLLRSTCQTFVDQTDAEMDRCGQFPDVVTFTLVRRLKVLGDVLSRWIFGGM